MSELNPLEKFTQENNSLELPLAGWQFNNLSPELQKEARKLSNLLSMERLDKYREQFLPGLKSEQINNEEINRLQVEKFEIVRKLKESLAGVKVADPIQVDTESLDGPELGEGYKFNSHYTSLYFQGSDGKIYLALNSNGGKLKIISPEHLDRIIYIDSYIYMDMFRGFHTSLPAYSQKKILIEHARRKIEGLFNQQIYKFIKGEDFIFQNKKVMYERYIEKSNEMIGFKKELLATLLINEIGDFLKEEGVIINARLADMVEDLELKCDVIATVKLPGDEFATKHGLQVHSGDDTERKKEQLRSGQQRLDNFGIKDNSLFEVLSAGSQNFEDAWDLWLDYFGEEDQASAFRLFEYLEEEESKASSGLVWSTENNDMHNRSPEKPWDSLLDILDAKWELGEYREKINQKIESIVAD